MTLQARITLLIALSAALVVAGALLALNYCGIVATPVPCSVLLLTAVASAVVLAIVVYLLLLAHLKPLRNIISAVTAITERQIHNRLALPKHNDVLAQLTTEINLLLQRIDNSFNSQQMFVSNVSHELRTPLAALIAGLDLSLQKERAKEEYRTTIANALYDARRMNKLIDGLLNLAKASYNKEQITKQPIRLDELLLDARANILKAYPQYKIEILFETDTDDDDKYITVMGNEYLLNIAFANLIENNCKYSADQSSFIQISYWDRLTIVRLSDSGIGMSATDKKHLFNLFYRGEQDKQVEGHGIGMTLAQRIISLHEGAISVYSEQGKGTTFVVELPHI